MPTVMTIATNAAGKMVNLGISAAGHYLNELAKAAGKRDAMPKTPSRVENPYADTAINGFINGFITSGFACATNFLRDGSRYYWAKRAKEDEIAFMEQKARLMKQIAEMEASAGTF